MQNEQINQAEQALAENRGETEGKWLTFWIEKQLFGATISNVEQIVSMQPITAVPEYPAYAKGIINLRGNIIPLIDLRLRLGRQETEYNDHTCVIIINLTDRQLGLIVDEVDEVLEISQSAISAPPQMGDETANRYLTGVARIPGEDGSGEKIILCLDAAKLLGSDECCSL